MPGLFESIGDLASSAVGALAGGASGGSGGGSSIFSQILPILLTEGVKQGGAFLAGEREAELQERGQEREAELRLELADKNNSAALERLEKELEEQLQVVRLQQLAQNERSTQASRANIARSLVDAAVSGGRGEAAALLGVPQAVGNIR